MPVIDLKHAVIKLRDGDSNELEIKIGDGSCTYSEKKNREYKLNRGLLDNVRDGDEAPVEVSFNFDWEWLKSSGAEDVTIEEALKKTGGAAAWVTSGTDPCEPYCVDILIENEAQCADGATLDELIELKEFRYESLDHDAKGGTVSVSGKCNVTEATITRTAL
jgi:hypothetical protein